MALLIRAKIIQLTNTYLQYDPAGVLVLASRAIAAAGTLANLIMGVLALWVLRGTSIKSANQLFFLWLFGHINLFKGFGKICRDLEIAEPKTT